MKLAGVAKGVQLPTLPRDRHPVVTVGPAEPAG
jgi:hypothetical protein